MTLRTALSSVVLSGVVLAGCNKKEETPTTPPVRTTAKPASTTGLPDMMNKATEMKDSGMKKATEMKDNAVAASADVVKTAEAKITQVKDLVANNKFVDADTILKTVEAMKDQLPQSLKDQLATLRQTVNTGLAKLKMPG